MMIIRKTSQFKVLRYSFSETISMFFNRIKSDYCPCPNSTKFSLVIAVCQNAVFSKIDATMTTKNKKTL